MNDKINQWLAFIDMERGDLLDMAKEKNKVIEEAYEEYEVLTGDDEMKRLAEIRLMSYLEEQSALATARHKGTEQGMKEGLEQGMKEGLEQGGKQAKLEIAKNMLIAKISKHEIIKITGLTEEEINKIKI